MKHTTTDAAQPQTYSIVEDCGVYRVRIVSALGIKQSKATFADALSAADNAYWLAHQSKVSCIVRLPDWLRAQLVAHYQMEGMRCASGTSSLYVNPWNQWMREGYSAAQAQSAGILVHGWPTPATVNA